MSNPIEIMDEIERGGWKRNGLPLPYSIEYKLSDDPSWRELRAAVKAREKRITWLEAQIKRLREIAECNDPGAVGLRPGELPNTEAEESRNDT